VKRSSISKAERGGIASFWPTYLICL